MFLALILGYAVFSGILAGRPIFIVPVMLTLIGYVVHAAVRDRAALREFGLRLDNLGSATALTTTWLLIES